MRGPRCVAGSGLELATRQDDDGEEQLRVCLAERLAGKWPD